MCPYHHKSMGQWPIWQVMWQGLCTKKAKIVPGGTPRETKRFKL